MIAALLSRAVSATETKMVCVDPRLMGSPSASGVSSATEHVLHIFCLVVLISKINTKESPVVNLGEAAFLRHQASIAAGGR